MDASVVLVTPYKWDAVPSSSSGPYGPVGARPCTRPSGAWTASPFHELITNLGELLNFGLEERRKDFMQ